MTDRNRDLGTSETVSTGGMTRTAGATRDLPQGTMVGEYQIDSLLGEGGMGRVYSAVHPVIAKRAAVKILHPELSLDQEAVDRFAQEARSVNQIGHPNIVDIFAFGSLPDGRCYFVMEWLKGQSLRDRIRKAVLPIAESLAVLETVAIALEAAHEKGIVHRDLKPDNIFLCEVKGAAPTVKLLDFGIAKLVGSDGRVERTRTGNLLGTPAYISPEQARGQNVDHRTDIYALGALTYELLTGWLVFPADNAADMLAKHLFEPPPSARLRNPSIPPELDQLITAMLAKDMNQRPSLQQLREVLARHRGGAALHTPHGMPTPVPAAATYPPSMQQAAVTGGPTSTAWPPGMTTGTTGTTGMTGMTGTAVAPAPAKSRLWLVAVLLIGVVGGAIAVVVATGGSSTSTPAAKDTATEQPAVTKPEPEQPAVAKPEPAVTERTVANPDPEPTEPTVAPTGTKPKPKPKPTGTKPKPTGAEPKPTTPGTDLPEDAPM